MEQNISEVRNEQSPNPGKSFFKLDFDDFSFDVLPAIKAGIKFFDAYERKEVIELNKTQIYFSGYTDLIEDKKATARKKRFRRYPTIEKN